MKKRIYNSDHTKSYNHIEEVRDALTGLGKCLKSIENSLKNPNLEQSTRNYLEKKYHQFNKTYKKFKKVMKGTENEYIS